MTTKIKIDIQNEGNDRTVIAEPFDMAGDPPEPVSAGPLAILPGGSLTLYLHDLRSVQLYEGDPVPRPGAVEAAAPGAPGEGTAPDADEAGQAAA